MPSGDINVNAIKTSIDHVLGRWLDEGGRAIVGDAKRSKKARRLTFVSRRHGNRVSLTATGKNAATLAITHDINVPPGGFQPKGDKPFPIIKAHGEMRFRWRTYNKFGGSTIRVRGALSVALKGNINRISLKSLADNVGGTLGFGFASEIARALNTQKGIRAVHTGSRNLTHPRFVFIPNNG